MDSITEVTPWRRACRETFAPAPGVSREIHGAWRATPTAITGGARRGALIANARGRAGRLAFEIPGAWRATPTSITGGARRGALIANARGRAGRLAFEIPGA